MGKGDRSRMKKDRSKNGLSLEVMNGNQNLQKEGKERRNEGQVKNWRGFQEGSLGPEITQTGRIT